MSIFDQAFTRRIIEVRSAVIRGSRVSVTELLDQIEEFTNYADVSNEVYLEGNRDGIGIHEARLETEQEYDKRIAEAKAHALAVQAEADRSWKKQQARFARSRSRKKSALT
jgi:hypothetical protein